MRKELVLGASLVVHWLRLQVPSAGGSGSIPGQGTRSHMPQLRVHMLQLKILHATTNTWWSKKKKKNPIWIIYCKNTQNYTVTFYVFMLGFLVFYFVLLV